MLRLVAAALLSVGGGGPIVLPAPVGTIPVPRAAFADRPERLRTSSVPGPLSDTERLEVGVSPTGVPVTIELTQRLDLSGTGDYVIRVRGTAMFAKALDGTPVPVLQRSAVVWQGFVPGHRALAARIGLDPLTEAPRLPLGVELTWTGPGRIDAFGSVPGAGTLGVKLVNRTRRNERLPTGDATAAALAGPLDTLLRYAGSPGSTAPPMAGRGLPKTLPGSVSGAQDVVSYAPLRVTGTVRVTGGGAVAVTGPGTTPLPSGDGAAVAGVLSDTADLSLAVASGKLELDLSVVPALDARLLRPPGGARSWSAWAAGRPDAAARRTAVDQLVLGAALAARDDEYAPYFGHHGPGPVSTAFHYRLAPPVLVALPARPLSPRPLPIALTVLGLLVVSGGAAVGWRRL